jgi:hypothetical protein
MPHDEVIATGEKLPLVVYSSKTDFGFNELHECLENKHKECEVIRNVIANLEKEQLFRTLFGK